LGSYATHHRWDVTFDTGLYDAMVAPVLILPAVLAEQTGHFSG